MNGFASGIDGKGVEPIIPAGVPFVFAAPN